MLLAPMEDVTDASFRILCREQGAAAVYTEFVPSDGLIRDAHKAIEKMSIEIRKEYGDLPFVYAGGVMSDSIIRDRLTASYDCSFALPAFSCDNAAGIAVLASIKDQR